MKICKRYYWFGLMLALCGCSSPASVPQSYKPYNCKDGTFSIQYPDKWEAQGGGKGTYAWAKFTSGNAEILVNTSVASSLIGDIASAGTMASGMDGASDPSREPVAKVHEMEREGFEEDEGVKEKPPVVIQTKMNDGRKSEFTGSKTFGGAIHGYRTTVLGHDYRLRVVCTCSQAQWKVLQPAFDKVIESLAPGRPEM
jgi:hypothetical protein